MKARYAFSVDWADPHSSITFKFQLMFYVEDGSIEMFDIKNRRIFLKKTVMPSIKAEDLYIGAIVTVFSRQLQVVAYADDFTEKALARTQEKCGVIITPAGLPDLGKILTALTKSGFKLGMLKTLPEGTYMDLVAADAPSKLDALLPSLVEHFGQVLSAAAGGPALVPFSPPKPVTCLVVKPHALSAGYAGYIVDAVLAAGFDVAGATTVALDRANATEFLAVYRGVVPEYQAFIEELSSGMALALALSDKDGDPPVQRLRELCGPSDPEIARTLRPNSLRAQFGGDKVRNAVHCTDLPEDGDLEAFFFF